MQTWPVPHGISIGGRSFAARGCRWPCPFWRRWRKPIRLPGAVIRAIAPVVVACVFEEIEPELTRISLRSKSEKVNVNEIAKLFGGQFAFAFHSAVDLLTYRGRVVRIMVDGVHPLGELR